ncbi:MAG: hypothetical protein MZW92_76975 [Comamonadaceae bacterium]|nr:hypothetical protein [Comamonadaceae bacterium]
MIAAACRRPIRFVMDHAHLPACRCSASCSAKAAPSPSPRRREDPAAAASAPIDEIARGPGARAISSASFPRAASPTTASCQPFRTGIGAHRRARTPVPVVPMALRGLWGSFFSRMGGAAMTQAVPPRPVQPHRAGGRARHGAAAGDTASAAARRGGAARRLEVGNGNVASRHARRPDSGRPGRQLRARPRRSSAGSGGGRVLPAQPRRGPARRRGSPARAGSQARLALPPAATDAGAHSGARRHGPACRICAARSSRSGRGRHARRRFRRDARVRDADCASAAARAAAGRTVPNRPRAWPKRRSRACGRGSSPAICWPRSASCSSSSASPRP